MPSLLAAALAILLAAQGSILQIRVLEGEGSVNLTASRGSGLRLEVTDEIGNPVAGAVISVRLPDQGPAGVFSSGLASEILTTGADGRVATSPIRWNRLPGPVQIRVTAVKERLRAGTVISQTLSDAAGKRSAPAPLAVRGKPRSRWLLVAIIAGGAAGAGFSMGLVARSSHESAPAAIPSVQIGPPAITITKP